jgi:endonuclease-8
MPEGPSIVILKEAVQLFKGKKVLSVSGNSSIDKDRLVNQKVTDFKSWGKHFLISFPNFSLRIHFMLFGSYSINETNNKIPRLHLHFSNGDLYFYACSIKFIEEDINLVYDWSGDVLNEKWHPGKARKKLKAQPDQVVCDALLDQNIFAGVGNIIKNEVLFRIRVHPENRVSDLPPRKLTELVNEACNYSYDFLDWKKAFVLKKHWLVHTKRTCPRCNIPLIKEYLGKTNRRTFYCENCQVLYGKPKKAAKKKARKKSVTRNAKRLTHNTRRRTKSKT